METSPAIPFLPPETDAVVLIGEVGGYTGLLLGYSLMDVPPLLKSLCDIYNNIYVWILLKVK